MKTTDLEGAVVQCDKADILPWCRKDCEHYLPHIYEPFRCNHTCSSDGDKATTVHCKCVSPTGE